MFLAPGEGDAATVEEESAARTRNGDAQSADALRVLRGDIR
jgi:hypothetical protein